MRHLQRIRRSRPKCRVDTQRPLGHTGDVPVRDLKRLAGAVRAAREKLGLSQEEFAQRGDLAPKTAQRLEWGTVAPRAKTLSKLDRAADWPPGTARKILDGELEAAPDGPPPALEHATAAHQRIVEMTWAEFALRIADVVEVQGPEEAGQLLERITAIREEARQRT